MNNWHIVLLVFAFVCFVLAAFPFATPVWNRLIAAGLAFMVAAQLFGGLLAR